MASREARRICDRLSGKKDAPGAEKKKRNWIAIPTFIILGLVLVGLLWWGNSGSAGGATQITFGQYNGVPIVWSSGNYFARKVADAMQINDNSSEQAIRMLMPYMIFHAAALQEAQKSGIAVCDKEVEDYIVNAGARERYNSVDSVERHNLFEYFKEELIEVKVLQTMLQSVENTNLQNFAATMGAQEKRFRFVQWAYDDYPVQEVVAYATENPDQFKRIKLSRLTATKETDAKAAYDKITLKQSTFDEQLTQLSASQTEGTASMDWTLFYSFADDIGNPEVAKKIFALKKGEISEVVSLSGQWAIYRVDEEAVPADLSDKKTVDEIRNYILIYQKGRVETFYETTAKTFLDKARAASLEKAATADGVKLMETDFFPLNADTLSFLKIIPGLKVGSGSLSDAQNDTGFFRQAFSLKKGAVSDPILLGGKVIILELLEEREIVKEDFDNIKSDFKGFHERYFGDFLFIIVDHLYVVGEPIFSTEQYQQPIAPYTYHQLITNTNAELRQYYLSQIVYNPTGIFPQDRIQDWPQFYLAFVDEEKAGSMTERETLFQKGLDDFRSALSQ